MIVSSWYFQPENEKGYLITEMTNVEVIHSPYILYSNAC